MNSEVVQGKLFKVIFRNLENGYTIFKLRPVLSNTLADKLKGGYITCKGYLPEINENISNIPLEFYGVWETNAYGWTFCFQDFIEKSWNEVILRDYLTSIKGINQKNAENLMKEFSYDNFFDEITKPGATFRVAASLNAEISSAEKMVGEIVSQMKKREFMKFIFDHQGKLKHVNRLFNTYGAEGLEKLKNDPYVIGDKIGLTLDSCDSIAESQGMNMKSPQRLLAYVQKYLERAAMSGHMYVKYLDMTQAICEKIGDSTISTLDIMKAVRNSKKIDNIRYKDCSLCYLKYLRNAEDSLSSDVLRLQSSAVETLAYSANEKLSKVVLEKIENIEKALGIEYAKEQRSAFSLLRKTGLGILTGGPGTGKTTVVKGIIDVYESMYPEKKIKLCAPTGRAAQRMSESTGRPATTIHRLLEYTPYEGDEENIKSKNEFDPIDADLIVVDEVSMLDCVLASLFFKAVKSGTMVIFVGDINQLQSVGAGDVLNDLIQSGIVPVEQLIKTYRQASNSNIIKNANEINIGHSSLLTGDDFEIITCQNLNEKIKEVVQKYHKNNDLFYVQVLSPSHKNDGGVSELNKILQDTLNPGDDVPTLNYGRSLKLKLGDKILMTKNNIEKGYFNGDVGYITDVGLDSVTVKIQNQSIIINSSNFDDIKLAYSMTIHKSQGSEFPIVIIALPNSGMLKRNLLYTAVTRAKKKVIIVQHQAAIAMAVSKNEVGRRNSTLQAKLRKEEMFKG